MENEKRSGYEADCERSFVYTLKTREMQAAAAFAAAASGGNFPLLLVENYADGQRVTGLDGYRMHSCNVGEDVFAPGVYMYAKAADGARLMIRANFAADSAAVMATAANLTRGKVDAAKVCCVVDTTNPCDVGRALCQLGSDGVTGLDAGHVMEAAKLVKGVAKFLYGGGMVVIATETWSAYIAARQAAAARPGNGGAA